MRVHRAFGRWSGTAALVPEWMWWAHMLLAAVAAVALLVRFELPIWLGVLVFVLGTATLTVGLFHRVSAILVALLGTVVVMAASAVVLGALLSMLARKVFGDPAVYACCGLGALIGLWIAVASYRPFLLDVRRS